MSLRDHLIAAGLAAVVMAVSLTVDRTPDTTVVSDPQTAAEASR